MAEVLQLNLHWDVAGKWPHRAHFSLENSEKIQAWLSVLFKFLIIFFGFFDW